MTLVDRLNALREQATQGDRLERVAKGYEEMVDLQDGLLRRCADRIDELEARNAKLAAVVEAARWDHKDPYRGCPLGGKPEGCLVCNALDALEADDE